MAHDRDEALGERAQHLLRILIESYIRDGQPVGSRALSRESGLQLSSATVRNVMAEVGGEATNPSSSRSAMTLRTAAEPSCSPASRARAPEPTSGPSRM